MGIHLARLQVVNGLEPLTVCSTARVRSMYERYEDICPSHALWERAFYELLDCWDDSPEACSRAFQILDTDGAGVVDAREIMAAMAVLSRGHLKDRMSLLFDIFDLNKEGTISYGDCTVMLARTLVGLHKMVSSKVPSDAVIDNMVFQVWRVARKHKASRIAVEDLHCWWCKDAVVRAVLEAFTYSPEETSGLPTPEQFTSVNYAKGITQDADGKPFIAVSRFNPAQDPSPLEGAG
eukprot:TRINITY_DN112169_c0_g1_i1.p1 TRINITY_DN112169_c0_g1~~TRINITY_DN112169_c0_g1_i1.p1  ORF type:complete len:248 (+),score=33.35 TRINITY_DN112169_c0_g1_i1:38-745(+)